MNESRLSWTLRKFAQHGVFLLIRDGLTMAASVTVIGGMLYAGPDFTSGETITDEAEKILYDESLNDSTTLTEETRDALSEIVARGSKDLTQETTSKLIEATKGTAPPTDCHFPWRQNACVKNILENLQKRTANE